MSVSESEAREIARDRVDSDGVMDRSSRDELVADEGSTWVVTFPFANLELLGGEPHVRVDKNAPVADETAIVDVFYTQ